MPVFATCIKSAMTGGALELPIAAITRIFIDTFGLLILH
jgi:hypothetical protein